MKRKNWFQGVAMATALAVLSSSVGCAYLLHPHRRGSRGGHLDIGCLVMDLLWLIPGIVPGVIALAVDFSSGAIYMGGGGHGRRHRHGGAKEIFSRKNLLVVAKPAVQSPTRYEVRLQAKNGKVLATTSTLVLPGQDKDPGVKLDLSKVNFEKAQTVDAELHFMLDGKVKAVLPCVVL